MRKKGLDARYQGPEKESRNIKQVFWVHYLALLERYLALWTQVHFFYLSQYNSFMLHGLLEMPISYSELYVFHLYYDYQQEQNSDIL